MALKKEIVFESNRGIIFERTLFKNGRVQLTVRDKNNNETITDYRYNNVPGLQSRYLNWENLNCCNGWNYDKTYLHTAVQNGRKLYAGFTLSIAKKDVFAGRPLPTGFYTESDVSEIIEALQEGLPGDCVLGSEQPDSDRFNSVLRHIYICKTGAIRDYIDIGDVISAYERLGIILDGNCVSRVMGLCAIPISNYAGTGQMDYANPNSTAEWVVTGLLLGYPIETTASMLSSSRNILMLPES